MRSDFFNEALVAALLAAVSGEPEAEEASPDSAEALRERLTALMDRAGRTAIQTGLSGALIEAADFAICAFIDEALLSSTSWPGRREWLKKPLQFIRHGTATAGEDFYRILDALLEEAKSAMPLEPLPAAQGDPLPETPKENDASGPLCAVLEIFALCLAQGFTGMFYNDPAAIRERLEAIGHFVPAVRHRADPFFFSPVETVVKRGTWRKTIDLLRRFDLLDWLLWIVPPAVTALLYLFCETRLDQLLQPFLQAGALP